MPKTPTDFSRCVIYKIVCFDTNITDCYVGNTTDFTRRKSEHKRRCYNTNSKEYNKKVYEFIRSHGDWGNFQMLQIEAYPCSNKREAELREEHWRKELVATLNWNRAFITDEERLALDNERHKIKYHENKEPKLKYQKLYRVQNKDKIKEQKKLYYQKNKERILERVRNYQLKKQLENNE